MKEQINNEFDQPIGDPVVGWGGAERPPRTPMEGRFCRIEPLDAVRHTPDLYEAYATDTDGRIRTYMADGPFASIADLRGWIEGVSDSDDPFFHALLEPLTGKALGIAAYMRIKPEHGVIEVGSIAYSTCLQRTPMATEAMFLMMSRAFNELGYRRYEWKCDSLNEASRRAALRLGFNYDGLFEQSVIYKGRNRDTAWYSILDRDWPAIEIAYLEWLDADNFDARGQQRRKLQDLIAAERKEEE